MTNVHEPDICLECRKSPYELSKRGFNSICVKCEKCSKCHDVEQCMDLSEQFCDACGDRLHYDESRPEFTTEQLKILHECVIYSREKLIRKDYVILVKKLDTLCKPDIGVCVHCMQVLQNQRNRPEEYEQCAKCKDARHFHKDRHREHGWDGHEFIPSGINYFGGKKK